MAAGQECLIDASSEGNSNSNQGKTYVFHRSGTTWTEEAILIASDGATSDWFGNSVSISGDYTLVGAFFHNIGGITDQGKAYVFHRSGTIWTEEDTLVASDGAANDRFGNSVSISGDYIVVGAYLHDQGPSSDVGRAYAFHRSGSDWTQEAIFSPFDYTAGDRFGTSESISGDFAIVGSPQRNAGGNGNQGKAYVFHRSGSSWTQTGLTSSDGDSGDYFGSSVSISGDYVAIGARSKDIDGNVDQGKAYIFHRSSTMWAEEAILNASDGVANDNFGYSIAISGDYAVVGALYHDVGGNSDQGKAYIFRK